MKTHNASIYHCISCGRIVHAELETEPPSCCRHTMTKSCEETIREGDVPGEAAGGPAQTPPSASKGRTAASIDALFHFLRS